MLPILNNDKKAVVRGARSHNRRFLEDCGCVKGKISDSSEYLNEVVDVLRRRMMDLFLLLKDVAECRTVWNELLQAPVLLLRMGARLSVSGTLVQRQVATMWSSYLH
jgi:hypothetical protein